MNTNTSMSENDNRAEYSRWKADRSKRDNFEAQYRAEQAALRGWDRAKAMLNAEVSKAKRSILIAMVMIILDIVPFFIKVRNPDLPTSYIMPDWAGIVLVVSWIVSLGVLPCAMAWTMKVSWSHSEFRRELRELVPDKDKQEELLHDGLGEGWNNLVLFIALAFVGIVIFGF